jgi:hypothetical protein
MMQARTRAVVALSISVGLMVSQVLAASAAKQAASSRDDCVTSDQFKSACGLTSDTVNQIKNIVQEFKNQNVEQKSPKPAAQTNCVKVDNFKPVCGLMINQLDQIKSLIQQDKSQNVK